MQLDNGKEVINIFGLEEKLSGSINIVDRLGESNPQEINILLAHTSDHFNEYTGWGADVIFSGDKHGGLIRLPFAGGIISSDGTFSQSMIAVYMKVMVLQWLLAEAFGITL